MDIFAIVHNIPSPYRLHLFRVLERQLRAYRLLIKVHFMAPVHHDRPHWQALPDEIDFPHRIWTDVGPSVRGKAWHFNPGLIATLLRQRPRYLLVGGPWDSLTGVSAALLAHRSRSIAWIEGNTITPGHVDGPIGAMKRILLRRFDRLAVPGQEGEALARRLLGGDDGPELVRLPNLVDERMFRGASAESKADTRRDLGVPDSDRLAIWNARLIPAKGILEFLRCLDPDDLKGWTMVLLGEGPLQDEITNLLDSRGLRTKVRLQSYLPYARMPAVYQAADLMVLPSLYDPNPLSIVEAMHAGLPLLVSDRIGNYPEALRERENGWTLTPNDTRSVRAAIRGAFGTPKDTLREMGDTSRKIAAQVWSSDAAVATFLNAVLDV